MTAVQVNVADGVVTDLNAGSFSQSVASVRSYAGWKLKLEDLDAHRVDVVPVEFAETDLDAQSSYEGQVTVDVVVRKRFDKTDVTAGIVENASVDPWMLLTEELNEFFLTPANRRLSTFEAAAMNKSRILRSYVPDHLPHQYTGVVRVTFDVHTDL